MSNENPDRGEEAQMGRVEAQVSPPGTAQAAVQRPRRSLAPNPNSKCPFPAQASIARCLLAESNKKFLGRQEVGSGHGGTAL